MAPKRKQQGNGQPATKRAKGAKPAAPTGRKVTDAASLAWQMVGVEEFGGLEVIEGVDVVRDGDKVTFVVAEGAPSKPVAEDDFDDDGEEFGGFSDDDNDTADEDEQLQQEVKTKKNAKAAETKEKKGKNKKQTNDASTATAGNAFEALESMNDDDDDDKDMTAWAALGLSPRILSGIAKLGFAAPTKIQEQTIPQILSGDDVIGKAQTGSGKTLAFGIPMVERWLELDDASAERNGPLALILSPTRELAKQLGDHIKALCDNLPSAPYICVVTGGLSIQKQQRQLEKADIVVGTPGRLWEVLDGDMKLQTAFTKIQFLVVDEADRLFKAGQFQEAESIIGALDRKEPEEDEDEDDTEGLPPRQTLVFSATFDKDLQTKLAGKGRPSEKANDAEKMAYLMKRLKFRGKPQFIDVNPVSQMAAGLKEGLIECGAMEKDLYLYSVLALNPAKRTIVFTNSISAVRRIVPFLQNLELAALPLHSQMIQKARLRSLERFTANNKAILVATDVAARGLDIKEVDVVLHYHVPRTADTYIHRSGRTARGDRSGVSVMLCSADEVLPTRRLAGKVHAERGGKREHFIDTLPIDRKVAARLKPRADLAKKLADAVLAKEKTNSQDMWLKNAAEELGVDYDSEEFDQADVSKSGRGGGRKKKDQEAASLSKAEMGVLRAKLRDELSRRVNLGVSERYIAGGRVDIAALLKQREQNTVGGLFLGGDDSMGLGFGFNL